MRCKACNIELTDYEATLRCANTDEFVDMCVACLSASGDENYNDRDDLRSLADLPDLREFLVDENEEYIHEQDWSMDN